jgi:hypothetical protein
MPMPRFSVVIPARRAEAVRHTLRTCLAQDFDDYEVVVCDNHGAPALRETVEEMDSERIRYVRAPRPLGLGACWELGVSSACGEYVTVLGAGGLLFHALRELDRLLRRLRVPVIRWTPCSLGPTSPDGQGACLSIPLARELRPVEARPVLATLSRLRSCPTALPMLSNAVVHRGLLDLLRGHTSRLFAGHVPDVYSGIALGYLSGTFVSTEVPMTVASAPASGGGTTAFGSESALAAETGAGPHPWVPDVPADPAVPVADSFLRAREVLFPGDEELQLDRRLLAERCVEDLRVENAAAWRLALNAIAASLGDDPALQKWFEVAHGHQPYRPAPAPGRRGERLGYDGGCLHLDAGAFAVADVHGAAELCERILNYRGNAVDYEMRDLARGDVPLGRRVAA